jgi:hypothetical protein
MVAGAQTITVARENLAAEKQRKAAAVAASFDLHFERHRIPQWKKHF